MFCLSSTYSSYVRDIATRVPHFSPHPRRISLAKSARRFQILVGLVSHFEVPQVKTSVLAKIATRLRQNTRIGLVQTSSDESQ